MMKPTFSVVIPTYNRAKKLLRALDSLNRQTYRNFEVLVCDDGSTDDTRSVVEAFRPGGSFQALHYFHAPNWGGPARPRNTGIREAAADWICFLDSDDSWEPDKLERMLPYLPEHDLLYHAFTLVKAPGRSSALTARQLKKPVFRDLMVFGHNGCIINSGVCVRKKILQRAGGFSEDPSLVGVEDADAWLKVARLTNAFKYIPEQLGSYYLDGGNITVYNRQLFDKLAYLFTVHSPFLENPSTIARAARTNDYHLGRIMQMTGDLDKARELYHSSLRSPNRRLAARSLVWLLLIAWKQKTVRI
jgi:glycosyltransferase involved in cell wall biosynthesis